MSAPALKDIWPGQSVPLLKALHILTPNGGLNADSRRKLKQVQHLAQLIKPAIDAVLKEKDQPVLADLGIEGDYCQSAVSAVEKVTTQHFQIVVTDWEDQPEAAFLLKTVRDLKAAQRPLTLAIVSNDASRPEALQAGANSILLKPIRAPRFSWSLLLTPVSP